jgi:hypothetical protein
MKTKIIVLLFLLGGSVLAAPAADAPSPAVREMASVEQFLGLSDAELDQLQQVIARLRAMPVEQRTALRREIAQYRQLPEPQREQLRAGWGWMPQEIQDAWREMMQHATPERRAAIQKDLQALAPEEKTARRRQLVEEYLKTKPARP